MKNITMGKAHFNPNHDDKLIILKVESFREKGIIILSGIMISDSYVDIFVKYNLSWFLTSEYKEL